jgi:hypothetical protein
MPAAISAEEICPLDDDIEQAVQQIQREANADYDAKRFQNINIDFPSFHFAPTGTFQLWLKNIGKLGGQHKVPRLMNNRTILEQVLQLIS